MVVLRAAQRVFFVFTSHALTLLATQHGLEFGSFSPELHVAFDRAPGWLSKYLL
ncbi:hypothetical protein B1M_18207 [Burkholderia sp. TJI49]|nr:hypothetical protein B1M_18207 [Burkholderia sp. TJI49]